MVNDAFDADDHIVGLKLGLGTVIGDLSEKTEDISAEGIAILCLKDNGQLGRNLFKGSRADNSPFSLLFADANDLLDLNVLLVAHIAHKKLQQVMDRNNSTRSAVFVNNDSKIVSAFLHIREKHIGFHILGHEIGLFTRLCDCFLNGITLVTEELSDIKNSNDIVGILTANGIKSVS